jgi:hypothetical protein
MCVCTGRYSLAYHPLLEVDERIQSEIKGKAAE